jgi:hypothetical protein
VRSASAGRRFRPTCALGVIVLLCAALEASQRGSNLTSAFGAYVSWLSNSLVTVEEMKMNTAPRTADWYNIPKGDTDRTRELQDGSLRFEVRSGEIFTAPPGSWNKTSSGGYQIQYSFLNAARGIDLRNRPA